MQLAQLVLSRSVGWECLAPPDRTRKEPSGALAEAIDDAFGGFDAMRREFSEAARARFGSGWVWLCVKPDRRLLGGGHRPILGLDVWEHAYYLKHRNDRAAYVDGWWDVVD